MRQESFSAARINEDNLYFMYAAGIWLSFHYLSLKTIDKMLQC